MAGRWKRIWNDAASWVQNLGVVGAVLGLVFGALTVEDVPDGQTLQARLEASFWAATVGGMVGGVIGLAVGLAMARAGAPGLADLQGETRRRLLDRLSSRYAKAVRSALPTATRLTQHFEPYPLVHGQAFVQQALTVSSNLERAYDQSRPAEAAGGRMMILGAPGCGKSIALLKLATDLLAEARQDVDRPVPVIFHLGGWSSAHATIQDWMVDQLTQPSGLLPGQTAVARALVEGHHVAGLFDGLDELDLADRRRECLDRLIDHAEGLPPRVPFLLTSRLDELREINADQVWYRRSPVIQGIILKRLPAARVKDVLRQELRQGAGALVERLEQEPDGPLAETLRVPLWLALTLQASRTEDLLGARSPEEVRRLLIDQLVDQSVGQGGAKARQWLAALARFLKGDDGPDKTTFRLEHLCRGDAPVSLRVLVLLGLVALLAAPAPWIPGHSYAKVLDSSHWPVLAIGLFLFVPIRDARPTFSTVDFKPLEILLAMGLGAVLGLVFRGGWLLVQALGWTASMPTVEASLFCGMLGALPMVLLRRSVVTSAGRLRDAERASRRSVALNAGVAMVFGAAAAYVASLFLDTELCLMMAYWQVVLLGARLGLGQGGLFLLSSVMARRRAWRQGSLPAPWRLIPWLEEMAGTGVLRMADGGVQFRHREILDWLATRHVPQHLRRY